jgi:methionyl-tRNA synthetase
MSREDPQFKLRLSDELRNRVANEARRNNRSMNAEIIARLEASFDGTPNIEPFIKAEISQQIAKYKEQVDASNQQLLQIIQAHAKNIELAVKASEALDQPKPHTKRTKEKRRG